MLPLQKVKEIVSRYNSLEKELSSGSIDPKQFASKSKEYANLGNIILVAKEYINFDNEKKDLGLEAKSYTIKQKVTPKQGRMVIFDGTLYHTAEQPEDNIRCVVNYDLEPS